MKNFLRKNKIKVIVFLTIFLIIFNLNYFLIKYANFFSLNNVIKKAEAIIILSGGGGNRVIQALNLHERNLADKIYLTQEKYYKEITSDPPNLLKANKIADYLNIDIEFTIIPSLKEGAVSTFDEAIDIKSFNKIKKYKNIIIVTDYYHTRRSSLAFKKIFKDSKITIQFSGADNDRFNESNWWLSDAGIKAYVVEGIAYIFYLFNNQNSKSIKNY